MHYSNFLFVAVLAGAQVSLAQDDSYYAALEARADKIAINAAGHAINAIKAVNKQAQVGNVNHPRPNFASAANAVNHVNKAQTAFKSKTGPAPLPLPKKKSSEILKQASAFKKNGKRSVPRRRSVLLSRADKIAINAAGHAINAIKAVNKQAQVGNVNHPRPNFASAANAVHHVNKAQTAFKAKSGPDPLPLPKKKSSEILKQATAFKKNGKREAEPADKIAINAAGHAINAIKAVNKQAQVGNVNHPRPNFASAANAVHQVNKAQTAFKAKTGPAPLPLPKKKSSEILKQATAFKKNGKREAEPADKIAINAAGHAINAIKAVNKQAQVGNVNHPRPNFASAANAVHQVNKAQTAFKAKTGPAPLPLPKKKSSEILKQATAFKKNGKRAVMYVREAEAEPLYYGMSDEEDEGIYAREAEPEAWYEEGEYDYYY